MQTINSQVLAALLVRLAGLLLIAFSLFRLTLSPSLRRKESDKGRHIDYEGFTLVFFGKTILLSKAAGRALVCLFYLAQAAIGAFVMFESRFLGRLLSTGL